jgi:hypothetical protein
MRANSYSSIRCFSLYLFTRNALITEVHHVTKRYPTVCSQKCTSACLFPKVNDVFRLPNAILLYPPAVLPIPSLTICILDFFHPSNSQVPLILFPGPIEDKIWNHQCRLWYDHSTTDHIFRVSDTEEKNLEHNGTVQPAMHGLQVRLCFTP